MARTRSNPKSNAITEILISDLRRLSYETKAAIWKDVAVRLARSNQSYAEVNLYHLSRTADEGQTILVPGKVLGTGQMDHALTVAALSFSDSARKKINAAGGETLTIRELVDRTPSGTDVRILS